MFRKIFGCKRKKCRASTGICGSITFGTGELDSNGYWEFPCKECEKAQYQEDNYSPPKSLMKALYHVLVN